MQRSHDTNSNSNKKSHNIIIYIFFVPCTLPIKKIVICVRNKTKFKTQRETSQPANWLASHAWEYERVCGLPEVYADRTQTINNECSHHTVLALIAICRFVAQQIQIHFRNASFECPQTIYFR